MDKIEINLKKGPIPVSKLADVNKVEANFTPGPREVILQSPGASPNPEQQALWSAIRTRSRWMAYPVFEEVVKIVGNCHEPKSSVTGSEESIDVILNAGQNQFQQELQHDKGQRRVGNRVFPCFHGSEAYNLLKAVAEVFLAWMCNPGQVLNNLGFDKTGDKQRKLLEALQSEESTRNQNIEDWGEFLKKFQTYLSPASYPYLVKIAPALLTKGSPLCDGLRNCFCPLELIWSYWHEEGMLVQSLNAICLRFQNKRARNLRDPLAVLRLNPLRSMSPLLWGYIQDEHNRLTVARRAYEYDHEYGLSLTGRAVSDIQTVDSRSKFLEAFHNLLYVTTRFYKEADDTTFKADGFPVLNALKELHLILALGAHNQFGDLPWEARVEMLIQKWLLARPEIREFLGGAPMVPYKEDWMAHVDSMKTLQGWSDVSVSHYRDLGVFGEQILLSIRHADWNSDDVTQDNAYNWAAYWRPEIQSYIHSYRAVTGVDLSAEVTDTRRAADRYVQPAIHQLRRLHLQRNGGNGLLRATDRDGAVYPR